MVQQAVGNRFTSDFFLLGQWPGHVPGAQSVAKGQWYRLFTRGVCPGVAGAPPGAAGRAEQAIRLLWPTRKDEPE